MDPIDPIKAFAAGWALGETYNEHGGDSATALVRVVADKLNVETRELVALVKEAGALVKEILGVD